MSVVGEWNVTTEDQWNDCDIETPKYLNTCPLSLCPPQIPNEMNLIRIEAFSVTDPRYFTSQSFILKLVTGYASGSQLRKCRRHELHRSLYVTVVCLTGRSDHCGRCKEVRHSERATECMNQSVRLISAHRSRSFRQLIPTSATYTHTHARTHAHIQANRIAQKHFIFYTPLRSYIASCLLKHVLSAARQPLTI